MRLVAVATLFLGVSCGTKVQATAHSDGSVRESFAHLQQAVQAGDQYGFCTLIFPYGRDLPISGLEQELRALRMKSGRARWDKEVGACADETSQAAVAEWNRLLLGLSIVSVTTHGDMATARMRAKTGQVIAIPFVNAAGEWRLLFRNA